VPIWRAGWRLPGAVLALVLAHVLAYGPGRYLSAARPLRAGVGEQGACLATVRLFVATRTLPPAVTWHALAACRGHDTALFFPPGDDDGRATKPGAYVAAREICAACPVAVPCLAAGMREPYGMWGGLSPSERRRRRRRAA
jgi:WhiB family redox-sensing transcriptional regulator